MSVVVQMEHPLKAVVISLSGLAHERSGAFQRPSDPHPACCLVLCDYDCLTTQGYMQSLDSLKTKAYQAPRSAPYGFL